MMVIDNKKILEAVAECIKISASTESFGLAYQKVLNILGTKLGLHSAFIVLDKEDKTAYVNTSLYLWCSASKKQPPSFQTISTTSLTHYKTYSKQIGSFDPHNSTAKRLNDSPLRRTLTETGIESFIHIPILLNGRLAGIMGLHCSEHVLEWSHEQIDVLSQIVYILSLRLEKSSYNNQISTLQSGLEMAINNANDIVAVFDEDGKLTYISKAVERILELPTDELIGQNVSGYVHAEDLNNLRITETKKAMTMGQSALTRFRVKHKNGKWILLESTIRIVQDAHSISQGYIAISRTATNANSSKVAITPIKVTHDQRASDETFLSMAAHQFKNPLSIIYSNAELIELTALEKTDWKYTQRIKDQVTKLIDLTDDIMLYGKTELKQTISLAKHIEVNSWSEEMRELFFRQQADGRFLELSYTSEPINIKVNPMILQSIFVNLIDNAFKYSPNTPDPICKISALNTELLLEVRDFGIGIPDDEQRLIFEPFFRAKNAKEIFGNGLGLSVVKRFTELLKGRITFTSSLNKGTTFWVYLPIIE
jgi:PAS domain S-box-containing protein